MLSKPKDNIYITNELQEPLKQLLSANNFSQTCVIVDENTKEHCLPKIKDFIPEAEIIEIQSGEENKNLSTCIYIWQQMTKMQLDRKAVVLNLGGGVIGDMGGFCASTYKRGIEFIQIPTTLLSQVDASAGGKLGIDFETYKNHIGVFREPLAVLINTNFLETLDSREIRSGYAEIVKHCLIADKDKWNEIKKKPFDQLSWDELTDHSVRIKAWVTESDPTEKGLRKILNFGHTIGHAIESFYLETANRLLHGEAIAIGMIAEAFLSYKKGFITSEECEEIKKYLVGIYGHPKVAKENYPAFLENTLQDKKNENKAVLASLLEEVGKANFNISLNAEDITTAIDYYNE